MACEGCKKQDDRIKAIEEKLDALTSALKPLIEFASSFLESPAGKLQRAMMRRKAGG